MERAVETILPRQVQKSALVIGEKYAALSNRDDEIETLEFTNEGEFQTHQHEILRFNEEFNYLIAYTRSLPCMF